MKKLSPKFINESIALLGFYIISLVVILFMVWTIKGAFKQQILSIYEKGVNTSSEFHQKVNHVADFLYQYGTYITLSTVLFFGIRILTTLPTYASQFSDLLLKVNRINIIV